MVAHSEEGVEGEAVVAQTKSRMRTALGAVILITGAESVRERIVCALGVERLDTSRRLVTARRMVLGLLLIITSVPLASTPIPHLCASSLVFSCASTLVFSCASNKCA